MFCDINDIFLDKLLVVVVKVVFYIVLIEYLIVVYKFGLLNLLLYKFKLKII